jgi:hypothetical protein
VCVELQIVAIGCRYQGVWRGSELREQGSVRCEEETLGRRMKSAKKEEVEIGSSSTFVFASRCVTDGRRR